MEPLDSTKQVWDEALSRYTPYATVLALSGGNDSRATYFAAKALNIKIDAILHINTRTGIQQTSKWVRWFADEYAQLPLIEADAGDSYENYVLRKGFFGVGTGKASSAHTMAYHILKAKHLTKALSQHIRQGKRNRKIFILNGARIAESANRKSNLNQPVRADRVDKDGKDKSSNIWVNLCHHWSKQNCADICDENHAPQNPVARELCRSGECMCGTTQGQQARIEASSLYPEWGAWIDGLESRVKEKFPWGWGEPVSQNWQSEKRGQLRLFDADFQPMCSTCTATATEV